MVEHDDCAAAGTQHAMDLSHCCGDVGRVMEYAVRVNEIEGVVGEIETFGISDTEVAGQLVQFEASAG